MVLLAVPPFLKSYGIYLFSYWLVFVIATMGLNLTVGYAGQKSLGHAAFFGIGAYTVAILLKAGVSFWIGLPVKHRTRCARVIPPEDGLPSIVDLLGAAALAVRGLVRRLRLVEPDRLGQDVGEAEFGVEPVLELAAGL